MRRFNEHRVKMGAPTAEAPPTVGRCPLYLAKLWKAKAYLQRVTYELWLLDRMLSDYPYGPETRAWHHATDEVQDVFPGSKDWMMSCSASEGGWGRWVVHGGGSYYPGAELAKGGREVGGNLQFTYGTFAYMFNAGVKHLRERGYILPRHLRGGASVTAWRSALGQAIAGGAAYTLGLRGSHWAGSGCYP